MYLLQKVPTSPTTLGMWCHIPTTRDVVRSLTSEFGTDGRTERRDNLTFLVFVIKKCKSHVFEKKIKRNSCINGMNIFDSSGYSSLRSQVLSMRYPGLRSQVLSWGYPNLGSQVLSRGYPWAAPRGYLRLDWNANPPPTPPHPRKQED